MSRIPKDTRLVPSVLDRLIDLEPGRQSELPSARSQVLQEMKASLGRDLQNLLNTRCRATSWPPGLEQLQVSLVAYGIPDCVGISTGSREQQEKLRRMMLQAIETFEPRLAQVQIAISDTDDPADRALRFRIEALLQVDPAPEPVAYNSRLDASIGEFSVDGVRR